MNDFITGLVNITNKTEDGYLFDTISVDVFDDDCCWAHGKIEYIRRPCVDFRTWKIGITYPNWSKHFDSEFTVKDTGEMTDDSACIQPYKTKAFYGWDYPFECNSRVLVWSYNFEQWIRGKICNIYEQDGELKFCVKTRQHFGREHYIDNIRRGSPVVQKYCSKHTRLYGGKYYSLFARINNHIIQYKNDEKERRKKRIKKLKNERQQRIKEKIKNESGPVLDHDTIIMRKNNPKKCLKTCFAYRKKWINAYGYPNFWKNDNMNKRGLNIPTVILNRVGTFLDSSSVLKLACCNRYLCNNIIDETFMNEYSKTIKKKYFLEKEYKKKNEKKLINFQKSNQWRNGICKALNNMKNINFLRQSGDEISITIEEFLKTAVFIKEYHKSIITAVNETNKPNLQLKRLKGSIDGLKMFLKK